MYLLCLHRLFMENARCTISRNPSSVKCIRSSIAWKISLNFYEVLLLCRYQRICFEERNNPVSEDFLASKRCRPSKSSL